LPIFDGGVKKWEWQKSRLEIRKQEENVRATFEERNKTIRTLQGGYDNLTKSYKHNKKLRDQYEKMLDIGSKAHILGERSNLDMLELKKDTLTVEQDLKVAEHSLATYEKQLAIEIDYTKFVSDYDGNWACRY
jgi:outer membrane protein TolC